MRRAVALWCSTRAEGYGPRSATVRRPRPPAADTKEASKPASDGNANMMENMQLATNINLRLSLAQLPHPSQLASDTKAYPFGSPAWRLAMVRLYRTILRLHNKEVAVSLQQARAQQRAVDAKEAAFLQKKQESEGLGGCPATSSIEDPKDMDDFLLTFLLTEEQREFGNRFVREGFVYHLEADRHTALTFYEGWYGYVLQLASGVTARDMTEEEEKHLSDEQREKMKELRGAFYAMRAQNDPGFML